MAEGQGEAAGQRLATQHLGPSFRHQANVWTAAGPQHLSPFPHSASLPTCAPFPKLLERSSTVPGHCFEAKTHESPAKAIHPPSCSTLCSEGGRVR
eukprot:9031903-Pyramimonas_sp.AAC.1